MIMNSISVLRTTLTTKVFAQQKAIEVSIVTIELSPANIHTIFLSNSNFDPRRQFSQDISITLAEY